MTPDRFRECLAARRWSQRGLADALGMHQTTARRWAADEGIVPANACGWLEDLTAAHQVQPPLARWQRAKWPCPRRRSP